MDNRGLLSANPFKFAKEIRENFSKFENNTLMDDDIGKIMVTISSIAKGI